MMWRNIFRLFLEAKKSMEIQFLEALYI